MVCEDPGGWLGMFGPYYFHPKGSTTGSRHGHAKGQTCPTTPRADPTFRSKSNRPFGAKKVGVVGYVWPTMGIKVVKGMTLNHGGGEKTGGIMYHHEFLCGGKGSSRWTVCPLL